MAQEDDGAPGRGSIAKALYDNHLANIATVLSHTGLTKGAGDSRSVTQQRVPSRRPWHVRHLPGNDPVGVPWGEDSLDVMEIRYYSETVVEVQWYSVVVAIISSCKYLRRQASEEVKVANVLYHKVTI